MAKSYSQLTKEIAALEARADRLRRKEAADVIARIKDAIAHYDLTPEDLFGRAGRRAGATRAKARRGARTPAGAAPRYSDGAGNVWGGRGPRPRWLRDALAGGKQLSDFDTQARTGGNGSPATRRAAAKKKRGGAVKYRDDAGNTWTGVGRRPRWFMQALADGKAPEDLAA